MNSLRRCISMLPLSAILITIVCADQIEKHPLLKNKPVADLRKVRTLQKMVIENGCKVNLCFGIDGSGSTNPIQFRKQLEFVDLVVNILTAGENGNYCAVQYSNSGMHISPLTSEVGKFLDAVHKTKQSGGLSNIGEALQYMGDQLTPRTNDANKLIIMSDGHVNAGENPRKISKRLRLKGVDICAIAVGKSHVQTLKGIAGAQGRVIKLSSFYKLGDVITAVVYDVCGYNV